MTTEVGEQGGGWSSRVTRADAGLVQGGSCGDREGTGVCFAVETTDLGMDPVWNIKWGSESEESWVSPGFGTQ